MTEEGKFYWLRVAGWSPAMYLGQIKSERRRGLMRHVGKPSCCLAFKGGPELDVYIDRMNDKAEKAYALERAAFAGACPPGTVPTMPKPQRVRYEPIEVLRLAEDRLVRGGKVSFRLKK